MSLRRIGALFYLPFLIGWVLVIAAEGVAETTPNILLITADGMSANFCYIW